MFVFAPVHGVFIPTAGKHEADVLQSTLCGLLKALGAPVPDVIVTQNGRKLICEYCGTPAPDNCSPTCCEPAINDYNEGKR